jgi:O-antigen ligase
MLQSDSIATTPPTEGSRLPLVVLGAVVVLVGVANVVADPLIGTAALFAIGGALAISSRPAWAVTMLLGSFLVTYPWWLQGIGVLTLNNVLGAWLALLMMYRMYRTGDWGFLRNRELQLLAAIVGVFLFSRFLHRPDEHTMALVDMLVEGEQDPARIIVSRLVFFVFLLYFIRTREEVRMFFVLAVALMVASGFSAIWMVLSGGGFAGYRARSGMFIAAAGNPNRLALAAIISIVSLWYLMKWRRSTILSLAVIGIIGVEVLAVFMTGSRSGVVALMLAAGILFIEGGLSPKKIVAGGIVGLVAAMLILRTAPEQSLERISNIPGTGDDSDVGAGSVERRGYTAGLALEIAEQDPILGVGIGNWEITRYLSDPVHNITPPHSAVLMALAEGGIVTLGLYVVLLFRTLKNFLDCAAAVRGPEHTGYVQWMAKTLRVSFMIFLALSLVGDLWLNILFYWFVGLGVTLSRVIFEPQEEVEQSGVASLAAEAA